MATQRQRADMYVCFNPSFKVPMSASMCLEANYAAAQGCWVRVRWEGSGVYCLHSHGLTNTATRAPFVFYLNTVSNRDAAWGLYQFLKWQWRQGLKALPEGHHSISIFLAPADATCESWVTMPRFFEQSVTASQLQQELQVYFDLHDMFQLPVQKLVDVEA